MLHKKGIGKRLFWSCCKYSTHRFLKGCVLIKLPWRVVKKAVYGQAWGRHGEGCFGVAHHGASCPPNDTVNVVLRPVFQGLSFVCGHWWLILKIKEWRTSCHERRVLESNHSFLYACIWIGFSLISISQMEVTVQISIISDSRMLLIKCWWKYFASAHKQNAGERLSQPVPLFTSEAHCSLPFWLKREYTLQVDLLLWEIEDVLSLTSANYILDPQDGIHGQPQQQHPGTCQRCRISGPPQTYWIRIRS